jgi:iron(III) transport system substrate-binding protein
MKRVVVLLTALLLSATVFAAGQAEKEAGKVVIYAALDTKTANDLAAGFTQATGIPTEVALQIEQAGTVASRIKTEAGSPRADVVIGGNSNFHTDLSTGGFTQKYLSPEVAKAGIDKKFMDPDGFWTGWYLGALCILYNDKRFQEEIAPKGIKPPATWDDLLDPAYKGEVIASNPATTGGAYLMMAAQIFRLGGEQAGFDYIQKLNANVAQYTSGANGSIPLVSQGEAIVGFAWGHDTIKQRLQGNLPITVVFPKDTGFEIGAASIIKGAAHAAAARKFLDFLLSPAAQKINAENGYRYPVRSGVALPAAMPAFEQLSLAPWDLKAAADNVDKWKKQWAQITGK